MNEQCEKLCSFGNSLELHNYITPKVCEAWSEQILARRQDWTHAFGRNSYTFGNAWYVFLEKGALHRYHVESESKNALISQLPEYVDKMVSVKSFLAVPDALKGAEIPAISRSEKLGPHWCWSGIHLSKSGRGGGPHADYEGLSPYPKLLLDDETYAFSALLSIQRPKWGGGLRVWKGRVPANHTDKAWESHLNEAETKTFDYETGTLTIIDSFLVHQILPAVTWGNHFRMVGVMHFLLHKEPEPHWEYWF